MEFRTRVTIPTPDYAIEPHERLLFVGSCFADNIGRRFVEDRFCATVNPYGVMYNPASILHTVEKVNSTPVDVALFTLGTNHVYRLNETGEIVDNCQKRPQRLFTEEELSVDECADYLQQAVDMLKAANPQVRVILTVSPIRYAKYGFHDSQLSKATLLLAADKVVKANPCCRYFPAYEIVNDELRDYRFYKADMLHPSEQAVEYIHELFFDAYFSDASKLFVAEWRPIKEALNHKPFNPDSEEYKTFLSQTKARAKAFAERYPHVNGIHS